MKESFELRNGNPGILRLLEIVFINDEAGKPVGIDQHIGSRPIATFGNSDGDLQILQGTAEDSSVRFALIAQPGFFGTKPQFPYHSLPPGGK